jgi:hypothetical protein
VRARPRDEKVLERVAEERDSTRGAGRSPIGRAILPKEDRALYSSGDRVFYWGV